MGGVGGGQDGSVQVSGTCPRAVCLAGWLAGWLSPAQRRHSLLRTSQPVPSRACRGVGGCWARDIPFSAIYFPVYAYTKDQLEKSGADK